MCIVLGLIAAFKSHSLHVPPMADLYSSHSYLGLTAVILVGLQVRMLWLACCPTCDLESDIIFSCYSWPVNSVSVPHHLSIPYLSRIVCSWRRSLLVAHVAT